METLPALVARPTPEWIERLRALVLDSLTSPESKRAYGRAITEFLAWFQTAQPATGFSKATVQNFKARLTEKGLSPSAINVQMTAIRRLAAEAADNGLMTPELAAGIGRVKGVKREGIRTGNWLTIHQAEKLINAPDTSTLKGKRDRALLAVL